MLSANAERRARRGACFFAVVVSATPFGAKPWPEKLAVRMACWQMRFGGVGQIVRVFIAFYVSSGTNFAQRQSRGF